MRCQLPAYSPLSFSSLLNGLAGALRGQQADVVALIKSELGASVVVPTDSGTSALTLALTLAGGEPPLIALPAYGCFDLATAVDGANGQVVLYDVDAETLAPAADSLARALARSPDAVVVVHLYGVPVDIPRLKRDAALSNALVIEDAAQGIGAAIAGKPAGAHGSLALLSFGRGKGLSAGGGGALLSNDARGAELLGRLQRNPLDTSAGWSELSKAAAQWLLARPRLFGAVASVPGLRLGETIYHRSHPAHGLSRASSKMIDTVWSAAQAQSNVRRANAARLAAAAQRGGLWQAIRIQSETIPGYLRLPLISQTRLEDIAWKRASRLGVARGYPLPLSRLPGFSRSLNTSDPFPGAEKLADRLITIPTHGLLTEADLKHLESWLNDPVAP